MGRKKGRELGNPHLPSALVRPRPRPGGRGALELSGIEVSRDSRSVQLVFTGLRWLVALRHCYPLTHRIQGIKRNRTGQGSPPRARSARLGPGVIGVFRRAIRGPSHNRIPCDSLLYRRVQIASLFIAGMIH